MQLLCHISRKYKDKQYCKFFIIISPKIVEELGWTLKDELECGALDGGLIVWRKNETI